MELGGYELTVITILGLIQICYFIIGGYIGLRAKRTSQKGVYFLSLQIIFLGISMISEILGIILRIQFLGYSMGIIPMICALIFVHKVFYSEKESPVKKIFPFFIIIAIINLVLFSLQFFNSTLGISIYNIYGKLTMGALALLAYSFEIYAPLKEWTKIKTLKIENHVKTRYWLFGISQIAYTATTIIFYAVDPTQGATDPIIFIITIITFAIMGFYVVGTYLTWFMPNWFKKLLNGPDQEIEEELPEEEIMEG